MSIGAFLRDRLPYMVAYALFGLLTVAVIQLDLSLAGATLQRASLLYIWVLGMAGMLLWLLVEYQRQSAFLRRLAELATAAELGTAAAPGTTAPQATAAPLDQLGLLAEPRTLEQRQFAAAWNALYGRLRAELTAEQQRGRQNIRLISQWAHHMKTPVAVIDLELQKARKSGETGPPGRHGPPGRPDPLLASIAEENQRLRDSLQMLLHVIRLEEFAADLRVESVDLVSLVRSLVNDQKRTFIAHRVFPRVEDSPSPCRVTTDAKWLRFALEQLVSNAVKYAARPEGEGQVRFRCARRGQGTVLEVQDDGIGIPPEDLGRVFEPFYTGANGRAYPHSTGLGLYLAREICRRLGHRITITSRRGQGTQVAIHFDPDPTLFAGLGTPPPSR